LKGDKDHDYKVEKLDNGSFVVTDVETGHAATLKASNFNFDYGSLLRFNINGEEKLVQFSDVKEELHYNFYYKGNNLEAVVYD
jgi:hypothetical protein